jgi:hypothetical protein
MDKNFDRAIAFVLEHEGGYVNNPQDPGGETNFGISRRAYPDLDIKNLTKEQAIEIYKKDYWGAAGCGGMNWPFDIIMFDTAVNVGVMRAIKLYSTSTPWEWWDYLFLRIKFYADLKRPEFLRGWINRVFDLYQIAKEG